MLYSRALLVVYFVYSSVYLLIPNFRSQGTISDPGGSQSVPDTGCDLSGTESCSFPSDPGSGCAENRKQLCLQPMTLFYLHGDKIWQCQGSEYCLARPLILYTFETNHFNYLTQNIAITGVSLFQGEKIKTLPHRINPSVLTTYILLRS